MPSKVTGTYWIAHILQSMSSLVDKFGLYLQPFENVIAGTVKQTNCTTLKVKQRMMSDAVVLLQSALFLDLLDSAKKFS